MHLKFQIDIVFILFVLRIETYRLIYTYHYITAYMYTVNIVYKYIDALIPSSFSASISKALFRMLHWFQRPIWKGITGRGHDMGRVESSGVQSQ